MKKIKTVISLLMLALLTACAVGPDYVRPKVETPTTFKEIAVWKVAEPKDNAIRGKWWEVFNDLVLNNLEEQVDVSNQNLAKAEAQYRQAQALVQGARSAYFPTLTGNVSSTRSGQSSSNRSTTTSTSSSVNTNNSLSLNASWEPDLWGRISRNVEASRASSQASDADLEAVRLSMHADLAQNYFQLRMLDEQRKLLDDTVANYAKSLQLTQNQYASGVIAKATVVQADTQLKTTQAQAVDTGVQRAQLEHAIAVLVGKPAPEFSIDIAPLNVTLPVIPVDLPSTLLERRPDIASAERQAAAANAKIGVAQAAFFPNLMLSAGLGFQSSSFANWLTLPNRFWSLGPALAATIFDGGARRAQSNQAIATYDANVAAYRQTVLTGFQEVEDNLAALRILEQEAAMVDEAVASARQSAALTTNQYQAGIITYLNLVTAQNTALSNERNAVDLLGRRLSASVLLIKALGGGWSTADATFTK